MEGNLTKGPNFEDTDEACDSNHGIVISGTLYNITDMAWIGLLGSKAVAGVGVGGMFTWFSTGTGCHGSNGRTGTGCTMYRSW